MVWKEKYKLGNERIDAQHRELFERVTDFVETLRSSGSWEEKAEKVESTLEFMKDYVIVHFRDEENYQLELGYAEYDHHKKIHGEFVAYVADVCKRYEESGRKDEKLMQQFAGRLLAWLINHVIAEDAKVSAYAKRCEEK